MPFHSALGGHGVFCYQPSETQKHFKNYPLAPGLPPIGQLNGYEGAISAFMHMGIQNVWVRFFGHEGSMPFDEARRLTEALRAASLGVAGWGYSHGDRWKAELDTCKQYAHGLGVDAFVADIEPARKLDGTVSRWKKKDLVDYIDALASVFGKQSLAVSTWPVLRIQHSKSIPTVDLIAAIADKVAFFAPQLYWMRHPTDVHYHTTGLSERDYPRDEPASFARMVLKSWKQDGFTAPLSITGQAYWGEGAPPVGMLETKIGKFATEFSGWNEIVGLTWWHAGGPKAMSPGMVEAIKNGRFGSKPFSTFDTGV